MQLSGLLFIRINIRFKDVETSEELVEITYKKVFTSYKVNFLE